MSVPIASLTGPASSDDTTGSIRSAAPAHLLEADDWSAARPALAAALDPHGSGALVAWENPRSGTKGSFVPLGKPQRSDNKTCRVFLMQIDRSGEARSTQGTACSDRPGEWTISEAAPWRKT